MVLSSVFFYFFVSFLSNDYLHIGCMFYNTTTRRKGPEDIYDISWAIYGMFFFRFIYFTFVILFFIGNGLSTDYSPEQQKWQ